MTDRLLVEKILYGDTAAFKEVVQSTERLVAQVIFRMVPIDEDRRDIAQDVYLKAFDGLKNFRFQAKLSTWIATIAYNTCISYLEKKKPALLDHTSLEEHFDNEPGHNEVENMVMSKDLSRILKAGIDNLQPVYKTILLLYHFEGLQYAEITEITGLPEGTLKSYLFRARRALRNEMLLNYKSDEL